MKLKKAGAVFLAVSILLAPAAQASPWAEKEGSYARQTGRKFLFGLQHSLFSWVMPWLEAHDEQYSRQWKGFCVGIGKTVVYTGAGLVQLVTFPIPVDFPDIDGIRIPGKKEKRPKGITKLAVEPPETETTETFGTFGEGSDNAAPEEAPASEQAPEAPAAGPASDEIPSLDELWQTPPQETPAAVQTPEAVENPDAAMEAALEEAAAEWAQDDGSPYVK